MSTTAAVVTGVADVALGAVAVPVALLTGGPGAALAAGARALEAPLEAGRALVQGAADAGAAVVEAPAKLGASYTRTAADVAEGESSGAAGAVTGVACQRDPFGTCAHTQIHTCMAVGCCSMPKVMPGPWQARSGVQAHVLGWRDA